MSLSDIAMACLALWICGMACIWLSLQLEDDIPVIALCFGAAVLVLWGFAITPAEVQMGVEVIVVLSLLWSGRHRWGLGSQ